MPRLISKYKKHLCACVPSKYAHPSNKKTNVRLLKFTVDAYPVYIYYIDICLYIPTSFPYNFDDASFRLFDIFYETTHLLFRSNDLRAVRAKFTIKKSINY